MCVAIANKKGRLAQLGMERDESQKGLVSFC